MLFQKRRIYADAAGAVPVSRAARAALLRGLSLFGNAGGLHREGVEGKRALEDARAAVARAIGAHPDEVIFTSGGTEANNLALQGVLRPLLRAGGEVRAITTAIEHSSVLEPLCALAREGLTLAELPVSGEGIMDAAALARAAQGAALLSVQLVNSEVGTVQDVHGVAKLLRKSPRKVLLHTDASQAPLWIELKVDALGVDLMTLDGQKCGAPKGVGALYVRRGTNLEPLMYGGGQEAGLRSGTPNPAAAAAFAAALAEAQAAAPASAERAARVRDFLWQEVKRRVPGATLNGPGLPGHMRAPNNLNISIPDLSGEMAVIALDAAGIAASTRSACAAGDEEPSHVLLALGLGEKRASEAIRITLLPTATARDARAIAHALQTTAAKYAARRA